MTATQHSWIVDILAAMSAPRPTQSVSDWCGANLKFNEPKVQGAFSFGGREYLREPLDTFAEPRVKDLTIVFGTRTGKTRVFMGGAAWRFVNNPMRGLWVMPSTHGPGGAQSFSRTRLKPMLESSDCTRKLIPTGARRHEFKSLQMILGGSILDFAGSNSAAQLASNPCDLVIQDEVDKFNEGSEAEADACYLADQRTKEFSNPKRCKASSPTLVSGLIWQELLKTDFRRRFVPCPHCGKHVVFAWSKQFTVIPKHGSEAYIKWDAAAKRKGGTWDLDRVAKSTHMECPFCAGHILDAHKTKMDREGEWRPTQEGSPGFRGYHLPSMYSVSVETGFGAMAVRFLTNKKSLQGLQGFINSDLAEPYQSQEISVERTELVSSSIEVGAEWRKLLSADCQQKAPYFWFVVRAWDGRAAHLIEAGSCDQWNELEEIQQKHDVLHAGVIVDSGFGARDDAEVYRECIKRCELHEGTQDGTPFAIGWLPAKGMPGSKRWRSKEGVYLPWRYQPMDPFMGTDQAGQVKMELFEFAADFFKDILANMRSGKTGFKWSVPTEAADETYWKHLDGQVKREVFNKATGITTLRWEKRHRYWPDHIMSCEIEQVALASALEIISLGEFKEKA